MATLLVAAPEYVWTAGAGVETQATPSPRPPCRLIPAIEPLGDLAAKIYADNTQLSTPISVSGAFFLACARLSSDCISPHYLLTWLKTPSQVAFNGLGGISQGLAGTLST